MTTYNTGNPLGSTDARDLYDNAKAFDEAVNSTGSTYTDRTGASRKTLKWMETAATGIPAVTAAVDAQAAKTAAETARDAAQLAAGVYATTAAGLAATTNGQYFNVPASSANDSLILYQNSSGTAVEVKRYPSTQALDFISRTAVPDYAYIVMDQSGLVAFAVKEDGTTKAAALETPKVNGVSTEPFATSMSIAGASSTRDIDGYAYLLTDQDGKAVFGISTDGTVKTQELIASTLNGVSVASIIKGSTGAPVGEFLAEVNYINNTGQSNAAGRGTAITTSQEYDNIGFTARVNAPAATVTLTAVNTQPSGIGESPMFGTLGHIKELILEENQIAYTSNNYQLLTSNNGYDGYGIDDLRKGTSPYSIAMSHVQSGYNIAQAAAKTFKYQALTWTQGEADAAKGRLAYKSALVQLANDYDADGKAITGQTEDVALITWQVASIDRSVALAQLDAHEESSKVFLACPAYQFDYADSLHLTATSYKWLGAYYGLVYKRIKVDKIDWQPLKPISSTRQGAVLNVKFHVPVQPLVLETSLIPAQSQHGFTLVDSGGNNIAISSVSVIHGDTIKIVAASSIPAGAKLRYGFNSATGKGSYVGGCGNLRDSQGEEIIYSAINKPMHNWCVVFELSI